MSERFKKLKVESNGQASGYVKNDLISLVIRTSEKFELCTSYLRSKSLKYFVRHSIPQFTHSTCYQRGSME